MILFFVSLWSWRANFLSCGQIFPFTISFPWLLELCRCTERFRMPLWVAQRQFLRQWGMWLPVTGTTTRDRASLIDVVTEANRNTLLRYDDIHFEMIRHISASSQSSLLRFYMCIWQTGEFRKVCPMSINIPLLKPSQDTKNPYSYRPLSHTSCLGKTLERILINEWFYCKSRIGS